MKIVLYALSAFSVVFGAFVFHHAKSSIHEILGTCSYIVASVLFSSAVIVGEIRAAAHLISGGTPPPSLVERVKRVPWVKVLKFVALAAVVGLGLWLIGQGLE